jgi:2'-5' RNA ligase
MFTQKYAIIQLFEDAPEGLEFSSDNWPLHSTIADTFAIDWDVKTMVRELTMLLTDMPIVESIGLDDHLFGSEGQVRVTLLSRTDALAKLHYAVIELLEKGGWKPNDPQFAKDGFLPHVTVQKHARVHKGDKVTFNALTIIDMFPGGDPYKRKVLKPLHLQEKNEDKH